MTLGEKIISLRKQRDYLIRVRRGVLGLPFGNRLPRYAECNGQLLLR